MIVDDKAMCGGISDDPRDVGQERLAAVWAARETAGRVRRQLERVRTLMHRLDPVGLGITTSRYEAVLLGFDIYVCMLADALAETVDALSEGTGTRSGASCDVGPRGGRVDRAEAAAQRDRGLGRAPAAYVDAMGELVGAVRGELRWLRALVARIEGRTRPGPALTDDWRIAERGLFGADGILDVLGVIPGVGPARTTPWDGSRWSALDGSWTATSDAA